MKEPAICENHLFCKAYARGAKSVRRHLVVYVLKDKQAGRIARARRDGARVNRLGLTVRKNVGGAVERNRVKRMIRAAYRACTACTPLRCGYLIVIVARPGALNSTSAELAAELTEAFEQLGMFA